MLSTLGSILFSKKIKYIIASLKANKKYSRPITRRRLRTFTIANPAARGKGCDDRSPNLLKILDSLNLVCYIHKTCS